MGTYVVWDLRVVWHRDNAASGWRSRAWFYQPDWNTNPFVNTRVDYCELIARDEGDWFITVRGDDKELLAEYGSTPAYTRKQGASPGALAAAKLAVLNRFLDFLYEEQESV